MHWRMTGGLRFQLGLLDGNGSTTASQIKSSQIHLVSVLKGRLNVASLIEIQLFLWYYIFTSDNVNYLK